MTNRNGHLLRDTLLEGELEATNHRFQKRPGKQWTHLSDGVLTRSQIDYVLVRRKWRSSIKNTEPCNSFNSLGSDHRAVLSTVKLSLRKSKSPPRVTRYNFGHLKPDQELQMKYGVEVRNRLYSALLSEEQLDLGFTNDVTTKYGKFIEAVKYANRKHLPHKPKKRYDDPANDPRVEEARRKLFVAKETYHLDPCEDNRQTVAEEKDTLSACYRTVEEELLKQKIRKAENVADRCNNLRRVVILSVGERRSHVVF